MSTVEEIKPAILELHDRIRDSVVAACEGRDPSELSAVAAEEASDTIYEIDRVSEAVIVEAVSVWARSHGPVILIAEGVADEAVVLPRGADGADADLRVIIDPIDGTRGLMYQKRSGWILTGVAPNKGPSTGLQNIELSVMTEIPLVKQYQCDQGWALAGGGAYWTRLNRLIGEKTEIEMRPSRADSIAHGFSTVFRPFPGARDVLGGLDDALVRRLLGPQPAGKALCFEDQYASTGGQMYELAAGHDRFIADIRPLVHGIQRRRGEAESICAHPYDACAYLLATEAGVQITGLDGGVLKARLDTTTNVGWIGYANAEIRRAIEPVLVELIAEHGLG